MDKDLLKKLGEKLLNSPLASLFEPNPDNHPSTIYKYRSWKNKYHRDLILKNQLYMSPPGQLNDPFDCRIYENYYKNLDSLEKREAYISKSLLENEKYLNDNNISKIEARKILSDRIVNLFKYQTRSEVISNEIDDKSIGISCFSEEWNSVLMWTHYGDNHSGFCVGFDEKRLRYSQLFGKIKRVDYSNIYPDIDPLKKDKNSYEIKYFLKNLDWNYEKEIRVMNILSEKNGNRIINLQDNFYKEIILGLNFPKDEKKDIIAIAEDKNIEVWQIQKAEFQFKLEKFRI